MKNKKEAAVRERVLSLVLAMMLVITGIPVNGLTVNAEEPAEVQTQTEDSGLSVKVYTDENCTREAESSDYSTAEKTLYVKVTVNDGYTIVSEKYKKTEESGKAYYTTITADEDESDLSFEAIKEAFKAYKTTHEFSVTDSDGELNGKTVTATVEENDASWKGDTDLSLTLAMKDGEQGSFSDVALKVTAGDNTTYVVPKADSGNTKATIKGIALGTTDLNALSFDIVDIIAVSDISLAGATVVGNAEGDTVTVTKSGDIKVAAASKATDDEGEAYVIKGGTVDIKVTVELTGANATSYDVTKVTVGGKSTTEYSSGTYTISDIVINDDNALECSVNVSKHYALSATLAENLEVKEGYKISLGGTELSSENTSINVVSDQKVAVSVSELSLKGEVTGRKITSVHFVIGDNDVELTGNAGTYSGEITLGKVSEDITGQLVVTVKNYTTFTVVSEIENESLGTGYKVDFGQQSQSSIDVFEGSEVEVKVTNLSVKSELADNKQVSSVKFVIGEGDDVESYPLTYANEAWSYTYEVADVSEAIEATVKVTVADQSTIAITYKENKSDYVTLQYEGKADKAVNGTLSFIVKADYTDKGIAAGKELKNLKVVSTYGHATVEADDAGVYKVTITGITKAATVTITPEFSDKKVATLTLSQAAFAPSDYAEEANVVIYRLNEENEFTAIDLAKDKVYVGDKLAIGLDKDYADIIVDASKNNTLTVNDKKLTNEVRDFVTVNGVTLKIYGFTAEEKNEITLDVALNTSVIHFEKGNYTLSITGDVQKKDLSSTTYTFVEADGDTALELTIEPNEHYKLDEVKGATAKEGQTNQYTVAYGEKNGDQIVSVGLTKVNNLTISGETEGIKAFSINAKPGDDATKPATATINADENVVVYVELTDSKYDIYSITATVEGEALDLASFEPADGKDAADSTLFKLDLGKLTGHTEITVVTVPSKGNVVNFEGNNYSVAVKDAPYADSVKSDAYKYSSAVPYKASTDDVKDGETVVKFAEKVLYLKAAENYRFTSISAGNKDLTVVYVDGGKEAYITGLTKELWDKATDKTLTISAELEETIDVKINKGTSDSTFGLVVYENDYAYHIDKEDTSKSGYKKDGVVSGTGDGSDIYTIGKDHDIKVVATMNDGSKTTYAITSVSLERETLEDAINFDITKDSKKETYTAALTGLVKDDTITVNAGLDKTQLQGLVVSKGHYTTEVKVGKNSFESLGFDEDLDGDLYLSSSALAANAKVVVTLTPENGYVIDETLTFGNTTVKVTPYTAPATQADDNKITAVEDAKGAVTVTIPNADTNFKAGTQKTLSVSTTAGAVTSGDLSSASTKGEFEVKVVGEKTYNYTATNKTEKTDEDVYFNPEDEVSYSLGGRYSGILKSDGKTYEDNKYTLVAGSTSLSFNVNATADIDVKVEFYAGQTKVTTLNPDVTGNKFTVSAKAFLDAEVDTVTIVPEVKTKEITLQYNKNLVSIEADGKYASAPTPGKAYDADKKELTDGTVTTTYVVRQGESLEVTVKALANDGVYYSEITGITNVTDVTFPATEADFVVAASDDKEVIIEASPVVENEVLDYTMKNALAKEEDGSYTISYGAYYYASVNKGNGKATVTTASLTVNGTTTEVDVTDNTAKFKVDENAAGSSATLTLKNGTTEVASFNFHVVNALTEVTVTGPNGVVDKSVTQTIDTKVSYEVTIPSGTSFNDLYVDASGCEAAIVDEELVITTLAKKAGSATIDLVNNKDGKTLKSFTVKTVAVEGVEAAKVSATYISSSTDSLMMTLASKDVENVDLVQGCIAYKVTLSAKSGSYSKPDYSEFYIPRTGAAQDVTLKVFSKETVDALTADSKAKDTAFDVTVQLVQLTGKVASDYTKDASTTAIYSSASEKGTGDFVVKVPYYAGNSEFSLTVTATTIKRGETLEIATVSFADKASYVAANVILKDASGNAVDSSKYEGSVAYNKVTLTAKETLALGNYTVVVVADAPGDAMPASKSMSITVEEGIWKLELSNVPNTLFKADKKPASFKATAVFNGSTSAKVSNKNVTWEVFASVEVKDGAIVNKTPLTGSLKDMVTVKNGSVTVNKNYAVADKAEDNTFVLVATSVGNPAMFVAKEVTITAKAVALSAANLVLAKAAEYDENGVPSKYAVLENQTTVSSDVALSGDLYLIVVTEAGKTTYTVDDLVSSSVTAKASNKNLTLTAVGSEGVAYRLTSATTLKNVKVTVTSMDGGKSNAAKTFTVDFADMKNLVMVVNGTVVDGTYNYVGTSADVVTVKLGYMNGKEFEGFKGVLNTKITVSGGKILSSDTVNNVYVLTVNKANATITVTDKAAVKGTPALATCSITNTAYDAFAKTAAPAAQTSVKSVVANSVDEQAVTYTFKKANTYKYVKVQIDENNKISVDKKNTSFYAGFINALGGKSVVLPIKDNSFTVALNEWAPIAAGAYKMYFTYGDVDANGNFIPATKSVSTSIKAVAAKAGEYTPTTQYSIALLDTSAVTLTGTVGKETTVKYIEGQTYSKIVDGKSNAFADIFEVKGGMLKIKEDVDVKVLEALLGSTITGYVEYRLNGNVNTKMAEINVNLSKTQANTYSAEAITMLAGKGTKAIVKVTTADGKEVAVADAYSSNGVYSFEAVEGALVMTAKGSTTGATEAVVNIVPETSFYTNAKNYGIAVTVKVDAKASFDTNVINITKDSVAFTAYDGSINTYSGNVAYTSVVPNKIAASSGITVNNNDYKNLVIFNVNADDEIIATVTKSNLETAVANKVVSYGETKDIEVTVKYANGHKETHTISVTFPSEENFSESDLQGIFTAIRKAVWNNPTTKYFPGNVDFTEAAKIYAAAEAQLELENAKGEENHEASDELFKEAKDLYAELADKAVKAAVEGVFELGADIAVSTDAECNEGYSEVVVTIVLSGDAVADKNVKDDLHKVESGKYTIETTVEIPEVTDMLAVYKAKLETFAKNVADRVSGYIYDNTITEEAFIADAKAYVLKDASDNFDIIAVEDSWIMTAATSKKKGSFKVTLKVVDTTVDETDAEYKGVEVTADIARLQRAGDAASAFNNAYNWFVAGKLDGYTILNESTTSSVIDAIAASVIVNENIKVTYSESFDTVTKEFVIEDGKKAVAIATGVTGTLLFTDEATGDTAESGLEVGFRNIALGNGLSTTWIVKVAKEAIQGDTNAAKLLNNSSEKSYNNVLRAIYDAIGNAPYIVNIDWNWMTQPTATVDGKVKYTVSFENIGNALEITDTITLTQDIAHKPTYQTFDEAVAAIKDVFLKKDLSKTVDWVNASDEVKEDAILKDLKAAIDDTAAFELGYKDVLDTYFTKYVDDIALTPATVNTAGRLILTVVLKDNYTGNSQEITLNKTIEAKSQTLTEARSAVETLELELDESTSKSDVAKAIRTAIKTSDYQYTIVSFDNDTDNKTVKFTARVAYQSGNINSAPLLTWEGNYK